jgi:hypothetical protein
MAALVAGEVVDEEDFLLCVGGLNHEIALSQIKASWLSTTSLLLDTT